MRAEGWRVWLRIAQVCPYSLTRPGGVQGQVVGISEALISLGHDVEIIAPSDGLPVGVMPIEISERVIPVGRSLPVPANGSVAPLALTPASLFRAQRALSAGRYDVVHVHEPLAPGPGFVALLGRAAPMVWTFHRSGRGAAYLLFGRAIRPLLPRGVRRCAVSDAARLTAEDVIGGSCEVLFNGVDVERLAHVEPISDGRPVVCFVGRHEQRKGLATLLEAFSLLEQYPEMREVDGGVKGNGAYSRGLVRDHGPRLWVIGQGPQTIALRRRWATAANVEWLGALNREDLASRLAGADVLCAPSLHGESFGVILLEAMATRTVVVASDITGYREVVKDLGVLVPPGDAEALAATLSAVLADVSMHKGAASEERLDAATVYAGEHSFMALAQRYVKIYSELPSSRG
ncbi:MAG: glycosyltransferase family 4 protein [Actinomycetota bacterium]|nr:glycosyltransferase family 4 protein [Actinomycetota bacterium]